MPWSFRIFRTLSLSAVLRFLWFGAFFTQFVAQVEVCFFADLLVFAQISTHKQYFHKYFVRAPSAYLTADEGMTFGTGQDVTLSK